MNQNTAWPYMDEQVDTTNFPQWPALNTGAWRPMDYGAAPSGPAFAQPWSTPAAHSRPIQAPVWSAGALDPFGPTEQPPQVFQQPQLVQRPMPQPQQLPSESNVNGGVEYRSEVPVGDLPPGDQDTGLQPGDEEPIASQNYQGTTQPPRMFSSDEERIDELGLLRHGVMKSIEALAQQTENSKKNYRYRKAAKYRKASKKIAKLVGKLERLQDRINRACDGRPDYFRIAISSDRQIKGEPKPDKSSKGDASKIDELDAPGSPDQDWQPERELRKRTRTDGEDNGGPTTEANKRKQHKPMSAQQQIQTLDALEAKLAQFHGLQPVGVDSLVGEPAVNMSRPPPAAAPHLGGMQVSFMDNHLPTPPGSAQKQGRVTQASFSPSLSARRSPEATNGPAFRASQGEINFAGASATSDATDQASDATLDHEIRTRPTLTQDAHFASRLALAKVLLQQAGNSLEADVGILGEELCGSTVWAERLAYYQNPEDDFTVEESTNWARAHIVEAANRLGDFDESTAEKVDVVAGAIVEL